MSIDYASAGTLCVLEPTKALTTNMQLMIAYLNTHCRVTTTAAEGTPLDFLLANFENIFQHGLTHCLTVFV